MPKDDSFYEDHTNRLWARWERENELVFYDSEEEDRHEQELQAMRDQDRRERWARWEQEQERVRRWQLLHPPKPPPSSDEEDDITFEELEDAVTQLDSTGAINWNSRTARTREPQRSHAAPVFYDSDKEASFEMEEQIRRDRAYLEKIASWRVGHPPAESAVISSMSSRETQRAQMADKARYEMEEQQTSSRPDPIDSSQQTERSELRVPPWGVELDALRPVLDRLLRPFPVRQHNPPMVQPSPPAWQFNQPRRKLNFSTKHGRRQHQQDLRRARANRKVAKGGAPRLTQGVVQPRPAFDFAVPTVPVIAVMVSRGLFVFGAQQRDSLMGAEFGKDREREQKRDQEREQERDQEREAVDTTSDQGMDSRRAWANPSGHWGAAPRSIPESACTGLATEARMHTYMDHLRLREQEREQREQREQREEREGEGESESTVDRLVCRAADDSSADDSASAASTTQLFVTIFALVRGLRSHVPCCWSRKVRSSKRRTAQWQSTQLFTDGLAIGRNYRHPRQHRSRCTRALMKTLGRSRWLNGLCRCLHSGCTDGTGPRPSIEP